MVISIKSNQINRTLVNFYNTKTQKSSIKESILFTVYTCLEIPCAKKCKNHNH
jgi:hypothetical protein